MAIDGKWDVKIKTPIGSLATQYAFTAGPGGLAAPRPTRTKRLRCRTLRPTGSG